MYGAVRKSLEKEIATYVGLYLSESLPESLPKPRLHPFLKLFELKNHRTGQSEEPEEPGVAWKTLLGEHSTVSCSLSLICRICDSPYR